MADSIPHPNQTSLPPPFKGFFPSFDAAFEKMQEVAQASGAGRLQSAASHRSVTPAARNAQPVKKGEPAHTKASSLKFIGPDVTAFKRTYQCAFHTRETRSKGESSGSSSKSRETVSLDLGCKYRAAITCYPLRKTLDEEPSYSFELSFKHHCSSAIHSHNVAWQKNGIKFLHSNKKLTAEELEKVRMGTSMKAKPKAILEQLGGPDAGDGRIRDTIAIRNAQARFKKMERGHLDAEATEVDEMIYELMQNGAEFDIYFAGSGDTPDLTEKDFGPGDKQDLLDALNGRELRDVHWTNAGSNFVAEAFGDVVGVDSTHNTNSARLPLYLVIAVDGEGHGHIVASSLFVSENKAAVAASIRFQKRIGIDHVTVILDKDQVELSALRELMPDVWLVLCRFHVVKYFRQQIVVVYLPMKIREAACGLWTIMVYTRFYSVFQRAFTELKTLVASVPPIDPKDNPRTPPTIIDAIVKNWLPCKATWAYQYQQWQLTRGRLTNNHTESKNNVVKKDGLGLKTSLAGVVVAVRKQTRSDFDKLEAVSGKSQLVDEVPFSGGDQTLMRRCDCSEWLAKRPRERFANDLHHASTRSYRFTVLRTHSEHSSDELCLNAVEYDCVDVELFGFSPTSMRVLVTIRADKAAVRGFDDLVALQSNALGSTDPRRIAEILCDCPAYLTHGGSPCRHCIYVLIMFSDNSRIPPGRLPVTSRVLPKRDLRRFGSDVAIAAKNSATEASKADAPTLLITKIVPPPRLPAHVAREATVAGFMPTVKLFAKVMAANSHPSSPHNQCIATLLQSRRTQSFALEFALSLAMAVVRTRSILSKSELAEVHGKAAQSRWDVEDDLDDTAGDDAALQQVMPALKTVARAFAEVADTQGNSTAKTRAVMGATWANEIIRLLGACIRRGERVDDENVAYFHAISKEASDIAKTKTVAWHQPRLGVLVLGVSQTRDNRLIRKRKLAAQRRRREISLAQALISKPAQ